MELCLKIIDAESKTKAVSRGMDEVNLVYSQEYAQGDRIILYTRADFPHDNWWKSVNFAFSDGSTLEMKMEKSVLPHEITFPAKQVCWLEMGQMIKSEEPSPFPALTQIEVYGRECSCES